MSIKVMTMVWDRFPASGSELLAMLAMADWCDDRGGSLYPSMRAVAKKIRVSEKQARRIVHGLEAKGFLSVVGNANGGAPGSTKQFRLHVEKLAELPLIEVDKNIETAPIGVTPPADVTPPMGVPDGSHGCPETAPMGGSQTVIEPSIEPSIKEDKSSLSPGFPDDDADAGESTPADKPAKQQQTLPACPHLELLDIFAEKLPELPQPKPELWEGQRAKNLSARWKWCLTAKKRNGDRYATSKAEALDFFERYFGYAAKSDFLTGRDGRWSGCDLAWLVKAENFAKVLQGNYENRQEATA